MPDNTDSTSNPPPSQSSKKDMVCLAEITSTHGIKGAVKIRSFTQDPSSIFNYPELFDKKGKIYKIKYFASKQNNVFIVTIEGIKTCNEAEALRSTKLFVERSQLPRVQEDEFYYEDLIGLKVFSTDNEEIGTVNSIINHGAGDILEIRTEENHIYTLPFLKESVPTVNIKDGIITINKDYLLS